MSDDDSPTLEDSSKRDEGAGEGFMPAQRLTGALPKQVGKYHIKKLIATGGMGSVYQAVQEQPRRTVALKLMKAGIASRSALRRFEYEAQLLARLRHPNIAEVFDAGTHDGGEGGMPYFVMEYIGGAKRITDYVREKKLPINERLKLFLDVCSAVHHGHTKGIIHRDLKPDNILVDSNGRVKVIDFGVARATDSDMAITTLQTDIGQLIGTVQYMSPEQVEADPIDLDTRSDVYSLGVVLYELVAEKLPYDVKTMKVFEATRIVREQEAMRLSATNAALKGDVETIVLKALQKDRDHRYQTAQALAEDIQRFLNHEPITARPPSLTYQLKIFARRHRALVGGVAAVFAALLIGLIASLILYTDAERARRAEADQRVIAETKEAEAIESRELALAAKQVAETKQAEAEAARIAEKQQRELAVAATAEAQKRQQEAESARAAEAQQRQIAVTEAQKAREAQQRAQDEADRNRDLLYAANMQLVGQMWDSEDGSAAAIDQVLASYLPIGDEPDLRDFAWQYQWKLLHDSALRTLFQSDLADVAFTANGDLLTIDDRGRVYRWRDDADEPLSITPLVLSDTPWFWRFSSDAAIVGVVGQSGQIQLFDTVEGRQLHALPMPQRPISIEFSADGRWLVAPTDQQIIVFDIVSGTLHESLAVTTDSYSLRGVAISPEGDAILASGHPGHASFTVRALDGSMSPIDRNHGSTIRSVAWSPTGDTAASGDSNGQVFLWNTSNWDRIATINAQRQRVTALAFSFDGRLLATAGGDGLISVWNIASLEQRFTFKGHIESVYTLRFAPDGRRLASADADGTVKLWDLTQAHAEPFYDASYIGLGYRYKAQDGAQHVAAVIEGSPADAAGLKVNDQIVAAGRGEGLLIDLATLDADQIAQLMGGEAGTAIRLKVKREDASRSPIEKIITVIVGKVDSGDRFYRMNYSPDGRWLGLGVASKGGLILDLHDDSQPRTVALGTYNLAYSANSRLVAGENPVDRTVKVLSFEDGRVLHSLPVDHRIGSLAYSPDGRFLVAGSGPPFTASSPVDSLIYVWRIDPYTELPALDGHRNHITSVRFCPDGSMLASSSYDRSVRVWSVGDWRLIRELDCGAAVISTAWSADGALVAAGTDEGAIQLWDVESAERLDTIDAHGFYVADLAFASDGRTLASAGWDQTVKLWNTKTWRQTRTLRGHSDWVNGVAFSPDGATLASSSSDGTVRLWPAAAPQTIDVHPATLRSTYRLAADALRDAELDRAESLLEQVIETQRRTLGEDHPHTLASMDQLRRVYAAQKRHDEAEQLLTRLLPIQSRALGEWHRTTRSSFDALVRIHQGRDDADKVKQLYLEAIDRAEAAYPAGHEVAASYAYWIGRLEYGRKEFQSAVDFCRKSLDMRRRILPPDHPLIGDAAYWLGVNYQALGDQVSAEALLRDALAIHRTARPLNTNQVYYTLRRLASSVYAQQQYDEAERHWLEAYDLSPAVGHQRFTAVELTRLYKKIDRSDRAAYWKRIADALKGESIVGVDGPIDLIRMVDPDDVYSRGSWRVEGGQLISPGAPVSLIRVPYAPPPRYRLDIEFTRQSGSGSFNIGLICGDNRAQIVLDGAGERHISTLSIIDGKGFVSPDNPTRRTDWKITENQPVAIAVEVRDDHVSAQIDGEPFIDWRGEFKTLSLMPAWRKGAGRLFVGQGGDAVYRISRWQLTPLP